MTPRSPTEEDSGLERSPALALTALLARWEGRARLYDELGRRARDHLLAAGTDPPTAEDFIEQQILTEQTEYIAEFFFVLHAAGCHSPKPLAAFIDRHNAMVDSLVAELARDTGQPLGPRHKQRLWRLRSARFGEKAAAGTLDRLDRARIVLSLKDLERFMALHMDATLCRDRLDALVKAGLLCDEVRPNLRLFWSEGELEAVVELALGHLLDALAQRE